LSDEWRKGIMATRVLHIIKCDEDGYEIHVAQISKGYSVVLKDLDCGEFAPAMKIFKTESAALEFARKCMGNGYQIRHKEWGIFQGEFLGLGFWYPTSEQPEQGFCRFSTREEAESYIGFMCKSGKYAKDDFSIEPFDAELSAQMQSRLAMAT
jgi:hypothetical protein